MFDLYDRDFNKRKLLRRRRASQNFSLSFDKLEPREMLAFSGSVDLRTNVVTLTQTADDGNIVVEKSSTTGAYSVTDGDGTKSFSSPLFSGLRIELQNHKNNNLDLNLRTSIGGLLWMDLGAPARNVTIEGFGTSGVGGRFTMTGGGGDQSILIQSLDNLTFHSTVDLDLGFGNDEIDVYNASFGSDIELSGLRQTDLILVNGAGDLVNNFGADGGGGGYRGLNLEHSNITGELTYFGINDFDTFTMEDSTVGALDVRLGDRGDFFGVGNFVEIRDSVINGTSYIGGFSGTNSNQVYLVDNTYNSSLFLSPGSGPNSLTLTGGEFSAGTGFWFTGGSSADTVNYSPAIGSPNAHFNMFIGDDSLTLGDVDFASLDVTFAAGDSSIESDTFVHSLSGIDYPINLKRLNGYNHEFVDGKLTSTQIRATPNLTISGVSKPNFTHQGNSVVDDLFAVESFELKMLNDSGTNIDFLFDGDLTGDLKIKMGDGARILDFADGAPAAVQGKTAITGGAGTQAVSKFGHVIGGDVIIDLGLGLDTLVEVKQMMIPGKFILRGVNRYHGAGTGSPTETWLHVVGNMFVDNFSDDSPTQINFVSIDIDGEFGYLGSDQTYDQLSLINADFAGNVFVHLNGDTPDLSGQWSEQYVLVKDGVEVHGSFSVLSSSHVPAEDVVSISPSSIPLQVIFHENVYLNLGDGRDVAYVDARLESNFTYRSNGPESQSQVFLAAAGNDSNINIVFGAGDDQFYLREISGLKNLRVDFGGGAGDEFNSDEARTGAAVDFETRILNFQGFNVFGASDIDSTHFQQIAPLAGENKLTLTAKTDADGDLWQLKTPTTGGPVKFFPTSNLTVNLLDGSETSFDLVLDHQIGQMRLDLGDGDREFRLCNADLGGENTVDVSARFIGGTGEQNINLAAGVGCGEYRSRFLTAVNLGEGDDTLQHDHPVNVNGAFNVQGVNLYENHSALRVGYNFVFQTNEEERLSTLNNTGSIDVDYNLIYLGGDGVDQVRLNSGVTVENISFIDLGMGMTVADEAQQLYLDSSSFGNFTAKAGLATVRNHFTSTTNTIFNSGLTLDFYNPSSNLIEVYGQVSGSALVRGGEADDRISVGVSGPETDLNVLTFDGPDSVILLNSSDLASLWINFGEDIDEFVNQFGGAEPFPLTLVNLP